MLLVLFFLTGSTSASTTDTYLEAYQQSHSGISSTDREYAEPFPYSPPSGGGYQYGPPKPQYGPPAPAPIQHYGPSIVTVPVPVYAPPSPHGMLGLLDKLKLKFDLFTLGKILLKIVIFKKFMSFVAVLCLLLFIPWLQKKKAYAGDDERAWEPKKYKAGEQFLSNLSEYVIGAIDSFGKNHQDGSECENLFCKTEKIVSGIDNKLSDKKLVEVYAKEVEAT